MRFEVLQWCTGPVICQSAFRLPCRANAPRFFDLQRDKGIVLDEDNTSWGTRTTDCSDSALPAFALYNLRACSSHAQAGKRERTHTCFMTPEQALELFEKLFELPSPDCFPSSLLYIQTCGFSCGCCVLCKRYFISLSILERMACAYFPTRAN